MSSRMWQYRTQFAHENHVKKWQAVQKGIPVCCHVPVPMNMPDRGQPVGNRWNSGPTVWANCGHSGPTVGGPWSRAGRPMVSMVEIRTAQLSAGRRIYGPWSSHWQQWAAQHGQPLSQPWEQSAALSRAGRPMFIQVPGEGQLWFRCGSTMGQLI